MNEKVCSDRYVGTHTVKDACMYERHVHIIRGFYRRCYRMVRNRSWSWSLGLELEYPSRLEVWRALLYSY